MKQIITSARETVAITPQGKAILLFAGQTLGLAGTVVLNARDAVQIAEELVLAAHALDPEETEKAWQEANERREAEANGEALSEKGRKNIDDGAPRIAAVDITATRFAVSGDVGEETLAALAEIARKNGAELVVIDTLSSKISSDQPESSQDSKSASSQDSEPESNQTDKETNERAPDPTRQPESKPAAKRGRKPKATA